MKKWLRNLQSTFFMALLAATGISGLAHGATKQANPPVITEGDVVAVTMSEDGTPTAFALTLNATDADMDELLWTVASGAVNGTATVTGANTSATVDYVPNTDFNGTDSFGIQVADGNGNTDLILVEVTISPEPDAPVLTPIGNRTVAEGATLLVPVVATDADDETPVVTVENLPEGATFDASVGVINWIPGFDEAGVYEDIVVTVVDEADETVMVTETFDITVTDTNRAPVLDAIGNVEVREERTLTLRFTGSDPDGDTITFFMDNLPAGAEFDAPTATLTYTPELGDAGDYATVAGVRDNGSPVQSDTEAFVITVTPLDPSAVFEADAETLLDNFATTDTDSNGLLSLEEAQALIAEFLESRFEAMDSDQDGGLSESELLPFATISDDNLARVAQSLLDAFSTADANEDLLLSSEEAEAAVSGLTVEQFAAIDANDDDFISEAETSTVATARAVRLETQAELLLVGFATGDTDEDGSLSREEAVAIVAELNFEDFQDHDLNRDGLLSETELTTTATTGDADLESAAELIEEFFYEADLNRDGFVSREEAVRGISTLTLRDFQELDGDGDGLLTRAEVSTAAAVGDADLETAAEALVAGFSDGDADESGGLSREEAAMVLPGLTLAQFQELDSDNDGELSEAELDAEATRDDPVPMAPVVVEGVTVGGITTDSALVTWKTQVTSTATVRFGTEMGSLDRTALSATPTGAHQLSLTGLTRNTTYYVRVDSVSADDATLTSSSPVLSFTTASVADTTEPQFSALPVLTGMSDTALHLVWSTDEFTTGELVVSDENGNTTTTTEQAARNHALTLEGLTPDTDYDVLVTARDMSGNLNTVMLAVRTMAEPDRSPARIVDGVLLTRISDTQIGLRWTTDEPATTTVVFSEDDSLSLEQTLPGLRREHHVTLVGLSPDTAYNMEVRSVDWRENGTTRGTVATTTTRATARDGAPVFLAAPQVLGVTDSRAVIYWETDHAADSTVRFNAENGAARTVGDSTQGLSHRIVLTGLQAGTTYRFSATSRNLAGEQTTASTTAGPGEDGGLALTFTTAAAADVTAPQIIEGPVVVGATDEGFTVVWTTDELADSYVRYGLVSAVGRQEYQDNTLRTEHIVTIRGLASESDYELVVNSADASGNGPVSAAPLMASTTVGIDSTAPVFTTAPVATAVTSRTATLAWGVNELAGADVTLAVAVGAVESVQATAALGTGQSVVLTNLDPGTTYGYTVRAVDQNQNETTASGQFTTAASELTVTPRRLIVPVGETTTLTVTSEDPDEVAFQFASSNPNIVTVDPSGVVTAEAEGQATIFVADSSGTRVVNVPVTVYVVPEPEDFTGFFSLLAILLIQNGESGTIGPCFIATAAAGTPLAPEIGVLRNFRDEWLLTNRLGTWVVDTYYHVSPPLADWIARHPVASVVVRVLLIPVLVIAGLWMQSPVLTALLMVLCAVGMYRVRRRFARIGG